MQFQIPQFIETEDKIVGPLTLKQFLYLVGAIGLSAMLYFIVPQKWLWLLICTPVLALGLALAFLKINGQPLTKIVVSALGFYWQPQKYVWHPENPQLPKNESTVKAFIQGKLSWENIVAGLALRSAREQVQTSSKETSQKNKRQTSQLKERYQLFEKLTGEHQVARRVDYR